MAEGVPARLVVAEVGPLAAAALARGDGWLAASERARLSAISLPSRRAQYLAGHWFARELAAPLLGFAPERLAFAVDEVGRPRIAVNGELAGFVSLSHSGERLACAYAPRPIGIDIEFPRARRDLDSVARYTFSEAERRVLDALSGRDREAAFYRLWALKEARGKRSGEGLLPGRARTWTALVAEPGRAEAATWVLGEGVLAVAADEVGLLAPEGTPLAVPEFWSFRDA